MEGLRFTDGVGDFEFIDGRRCVLDLWRESKECAKNHIDPQNTDDRCWLVESGDRVTFNQYLGEWSYTKIVEFVAWLNDFKETWVTSYPPLTADGRVVFYNENDEHDVVVMVVFRNGRFRMLTSELRE